MKIPQLLNRLMLIAMVALSFFIFEKKLHADDLILIRKNGLVLSGDFDRRSDEKNLSLIKKTPQIIMRTTHSWDDFQLMKYQGKDVSKTELLKTVPALNVADSKRDKQAEAMRFWFPPGTLQSPAHPPIHFQSNPRQKPQGADRVVSLSIDAYVANWDQDAELDGLVLHLYPINSQGEIVPVNGQVEMQLIGQRHRELDWLGRNNREKFPELEQWTMRVRKSDFGPDGATLKLEFRRIRPEFRTELAESALLTGSLGVAGQGRFDASSADVIIRPFSRFRDEHSLRSRTRSRVYPHENYPRP